MSPIIYFLASIFPTQLLCVGCRAEWWWSWFFSPLTFTQAPGSWVYVLPVSLREFPLPCMKQSNPARPTPERLGTQCWSCWEEISNFVLVVVETSSQCPQLMLGIHSPRFPVFCCPTHVLHLPDFFFNFSYSSSCNYCPTHTPSALPCLSHWARAWLQSAPAPAAGTLSHAAGTSSTQQPIKTEAGGKSVRPVLYAASRKSSVGLSSSYPGW